MNLGVPRCSMTELCGRWCLTLFKKKSIKLFFNQWFYQGFPDSSVGKESVCNAGDPDSIPGRGRSPGEGIRLPTPVFLGFPGGSAGKESACNEGNLGLTPGLGRYPVEGKSYPLQCSGLENSRDAKSQTWLSNFIFSLYHLTSSTAVYESYSGRTFPPMEEGWSVLNILVSRMLELACSSLWEPIIGISYQLWVHWHLLVGSLKLITVGVFTP